MPASNNLEHTARERLASGELPRVQTECIWGGYGRGHPCSLCGEPIRSTQVEFEVPKLADGAVGVLRFHIPCHEAWQLECAQSESEVAPVADKRFLFDSGVLAGQGV
jgi:hypothetical protein